MSGLKLGKLPARPDAIKLRFGAYFKASHLPLAPDAFGRPQLVKTWGMLGNDNVGDCVWAGAAHETMLLRVQAGAPIPTFDDSAVISDYSAVTGYVPGRDMTDQGTDMQAAAAYRQKTGVIDATGLRHQIDVYAALRVGDIEQLALATFLFGCVGIGVEFPSSAMDQFNLAEVWSVAAGAKSDGGHYIPCVGRNRAGNFMFVSWGRLQAATPAWVARYMDEGMAVISREQLNDAGLSPQGYDAAKLSDDFKQVTS